MISHVTFRKENDSRTFSAVRDNVVQFGGAVNTCEVNK